MQEFNNDDVKKMLERLREQADGGAARTADDSVRPQTTENAAHSDDEIKSMLKKQFSLDGGAAAREESDEYSFDTVDFTAAPEAEVVRAEEQSTESATDDILDISEDILDISEGALDESTEGISGHEDEPVPEPEDESEDEPVPEVDPEYEDTDGYALYETDIDEDTIREVVDETIMATEAEIEDVIREMSLGMSDAQTSETETEETEPEKKIEEAEAQTVVEPVVEEPADDATEDALASETVAEDDEAENTEVVAESVSDDLCEPELISEPESEPEPEMVAEQTFLRTQETDEQPEEAERDDDPISEESINYDEVLEGQQGTVFNKFVEDFTGELDDVVFEAEITDSHAPNKQYTIFEDWEKLMKDKNYATAEDGIIPPTPDELAYSAQISGTVSGKTDYFKPAESEDLDAVDIALMVALGGEGELNKTVGFEKIRQAVHDAKSEAKAPSPDKSVFGCCGKEYSSAAQNSEIKKKYKSDRICLTLQIIGTVLIALLLLGHEICGWTGAAGAVAFADDPALFVFGGLQLLIFCFAISFNKLIRSVRRPISSSSISYIAALIVLVIAIPNDIALVTSAYSELGLTFHSISAILLILSLIYDSFDLSEQASVFSMISGTDKKLVLEPYGRLHTGGDEESGDVIDKDSYCISRVPAVNDFFSRVSASSPYAMTRVITLVLCVSVALCVMLLLLLVGDAEIGEVLLGFAVTLCFTLLCASVCETEFAFRVVSGYLKRYKTGLIGKGSAAEYGKCNIIYFDDYNVFNKRSVRTKGLKLYDNNEIYRVLYHTQAVFSKIGGPLKGVFEFATTEMIHSRDVEICEVSKEGIVALVDSKTSVVIGTGAFMKSKGIHPSYTAADLRSEESGQESIMFIAIGGKLGAKLYVTYHFSSEFERLAKKLSACGVRIGIRSCDPNVNDKWAKDYGSLKGFDISVVRPTLKEIKPHEKSIDSGIVSTKNVRALCEALMMCIRLDSLETLMTRIRTVFVVIIGIISFALMLFSGINTLSVLVLSLACALCASVTMLLSHFYIKH